MVIVKCELVKILDELLFEELKSFTWRLSEKDLMQLVGAPHIAKSHLEGKSKEGIVDKMVGFYGKQKAVTITLYILKKMDKNQLVKEMRKTFQKLIGNDDDSDDDSDNDSDNDDDSDDDSDNDSDNDQPSVDPGDEKCCSEDFQAMKQYTVDVTLDPNTANPSLILLDDGKQVTNGDKRQDLPDTPERFNQAPNVLGQEGFASGRAYWEVQVVGKTEWDLGVARESISRKGSITLCPENGMWVLALRSRNKYWAVASPAANLCLKVKPRKLGVYLNYERGQVSFYNVEAKSHIYTFTDCAFNGIVYPFFSPCGKDGGKNEAPLVICPMYTSLSTTRHSKDWTEILKSDADLESINSNVSQQKEEDFSIRQKYAVDITLDPNTANPSLILSDDGKQVTDGDKRQDLPDTPERFNRTTNILGQEGFTSGRAYWEVQVEGKTEWDLGVARASISRKGGVTLCPENGFWTLWLRNRMYEANDKKVAALTLKAKLQKVGVYLDYEGGQVSFYNVEAKSHIYTFTDCAFTGKLHPFFSPCGNNGGKNTAPLIISNITPTMHIHGLSDSSMKADIHLGNVRRTVTQLEEMELRIMQQYAVNVILDSKTANPALIISDDLREVAHGKKRQKLPDNKERFNQTPNILGKDGFASGRAYWEVLVRGKTDWDLGVARESISRKGSLTLCPENGFWTLWLRNGKDYKAIDAPSVPLTMKAKLRKVGVYLDYEGGQVSFYNVEARCHIYTFTGCAFTGIVYPFFSPCGNDGGKNAAPLAICPSPPSTDDACPSSTPDLDRVRSTISQLEEMEQWMTQKYSVDVTLDPGTAHPDLSVSADKREVKIEGIVRDLPESPERFTQSFSVLGTEGFASGRFYWEVLVSEKTMWTLGVARESVNRKGALKTSPREGFWTLSLVDAEEYWANCSPARCLPLTVKPQTVGVFVDYEEGQVSFYNGNDRSHIFSFTGCTFTEKIYPFLCPGESDNGVNVASLIISHTR